MSTRSASRYPFALLLLLFIASSCEQVSTQSAIGFVPPDAVATISVRWRDLRNDPLLAPFAPVSEIAAFLTGIGLAADSVDSVVLFSQPDIPGDTAIVQSTISPRPLREPLAGMIVVPLSPTLTAIGPRRGVDAAMRTGGTRTASFLGRPELRHVSGSMEGTEPIVMALAWPQSARDATTAAVGLSAGALKFMGFGPLGTLVEKLGIGRAITITCSREGDGVRLRLQAVTEDEATASFVAGGLMLFKGLARLVPPSDGQPSPADAFQTLTVDRSGTVLSLGMHVSAHDLGR